MFFYLSFLRPPPLQASHHGTISITPQISNDLRTEPFENSQDLYFSWSLQTGQSISNIDTTTTKPLKLTTWRPSTAYKEIPVPLPPGICKGQSWRLILTGTAQSHGRSRPDTIDLGSEEIGKLVPFPVISMPVFFSTSGTKNVSKQEKVERIYLVPLSGLTDTEVGGVASLRFTEQTSFDLDKVSVHEHLFIF
jgi:protein N-lysine methyltransferase METTL21D